MWSFVSVALLLMMIGSTSALMTSSPHTRFSNSIKQKSSLVVVNEKALGKADVAQLISAHSGLSKSSIELILTSFAEVVREEVLVKGNEIRLREFGTFKQKKSAARLGRNPRTGEELQILASTSVGFSISSAFKVKDKAEGADDAAVAK